jgi:hypothetical protein
MPPGKPKVAALLAACLVLAAGAGARAQRSAFTPNATEFPPGDVWINAKPFVMARMRERRAVLVVFFNAANVNSIRVVPVLNTWFDLYGLAGLMVVGVHTPDYEFQRDTGLVRRAVKRLGARFPVVVDGDRQLWRGYANDGWPAFYLVGHDGAVVYQSPGEGHYNDIETQIRAAIKDVPGYGEPSADPSADDLPSENCGLATAEISIKQSRLPVIDLNKQPVAERKVNKLDLGKADSSAIPEGDMLTETRNGEVSFYGAWEVETEALRLTQKNEERLAFVRLVYRGIQAFSVLAPGGRSTAFYVRQDAFWLHPGDAGRDVEFDDDGRSFVEVTTPRLYDLVRNADDSIHELRLLPVDPGARVYGFSFADRCLPIRLP